MASWWRALPRAARRYPWPANVVLYAGLFSAGDAMQQWLRDEPPDWQQTRRVATLAVTFHANFNYGWLRLLERTLPGRAPRAVLVKVLCDQTIGGPLAISGFYCGEVPEGGGEDPCALMYWPFVQLTNFALVPIHWRTAYTGLCGFFWATFLCFSQQSGDGTLESAFTYLHLKDTSTVEGPPERTEKSDPWND
ncbi:Mpv17-like protein [Galemys pyrenaicus]|uniref:Mpv17-like protein n=1 Tax=Galemys pyrenaicus TaxID=202257 RepID=A0A8J6A191_GALPY|nr:Mpv17-like protein [Galemys pyrenaicus]